jgi:phenylacetyl-CoA:acceptor oxidoreductase 26-kDa subunit
MRQAIRRADGAAPRPQRHWDWRAAANFTAGGTGGGLLLFAAVAGLAGNEVGPLIVLGMALIATGLACVWLEIGHPWRALNVFRHFGTSWMSCEAMMAPLLFLAGALALITAQPFFTVTVGILGGAFLYSQARILGADKGIPAWRHPHCRSLVVATGFAEGAGVLAVYAPLLPANAAWLIAVLLLVLLLVRGFLWKRYVGALKEDGAPEGSLRVFGAMDARFVTLGHVLPGVLAAMALPAGWGGVSETVVAGMMMTAGLLAVGGGWLLKHTLITRAAFTQGFALKHLPVRGHAWHAGALDGATERRYQLQPPQV